MLPTPRLKCLGEAQKLEASVSLKLSARESKDSVIVAEHHEVRQTYME